MKLFGRREPQGVRRLEVSLVGRQRCASQTPVVLLGSVQFLLIVVVYWFASLCHFRRQRVCVSV